MLHQNISVLTWTPHFNALLLSLWALAIVAKAFPIFARESIDCKDIFRTLGWFSSAWLGQITVIIFWATHMCSWLDLMGGRKTCRLLIVTRPINEWNHMIIFFSNYWKQLFFNVFFIKIIFRSSGLKSLKCDWYENPRRSVIWFYSLFMRGNAPRFIFLQSLPDAGERNSKPTLRQFQRSAVSLVRF